MILVGSGGFAGANARYWLARWIADRYGTAFPYGTLVINVSGSLVIGFLITYLNARLSLSPNYRLIFTTGFIGAYTTFSTYTYESLTLMQDGLWARAAAYLIGSVALGMAAVTVGMLIGRSV
ncbi:MAG: fluoride efflux transporter CrcB [Dehalococcoidia bacterium]|nr:fluoride efflux transporter CrcB [Dehalococcoidia bacterium]